MISFHRDGGKVKVVINPGMFDQKTMHIFWDCGHDWFAMMLVRKLEEELSMRLRATRQDHYNQGWKDAKSKRNKRTFFSAQWND